MPDLSIQAVQEWLDRAEPSMRTTQSRLVNPIETDADVTTALVMLGAALDVARARSTTELSSLLATDPARDLMRSILAQLGAARMLRLMDWLAATDMPDRRVLLSALIEDDVAGSGQVVRSVIRKLNRRALTDRLFANDRVELLLAACEAVQTEAA